MSDYSVEVPIEGKCIETTLCRFKFDVTTMKDEYLFNFPLTFPSGSDWEALGMEKFRIDSLKVSITPYYNFTTPASKAPGAISGDFPLRVTIFSGNTAGEQQATTFSNFIRTGKYVLGRAYSGVSADFGNVVYKTVLAKKPESEDDIQSLQEIIDKSNNARVIDASLLKNGKIVLQKGRIVICVKKQDLVGQLLNAVGDGDSDSGNGAARRILKKLVGENKTEEPQQEGRKGKKRTGGNPTPKPEVTTFYPDEPEIIGEGESAKEQLMLDYCFYITEEYKLHYARSDN